MIVDTANLSNVGARLANTLSLRGVSYRELAADTGLSIAALHKIEHGGNPRLSTLLILLDWIGE